MDKLRVGHYGVNGHTVLGQLRNHPRATLTAVSQVPRDRLEKDLSRDQPALNDVVDCPDLAAMFPHCDLIVFCSPLRHEQFPQCVEALEAGKHVLAEKPCAFRREDVDRLLELDAPDHQFREMGGTTLEPAFVKIKEMLDAKRLGQVICQQALKSYPMFESRPKEERIDGGLLMQAGIHGVRAMQELSGLTAVEVTATEFNPGTHGDLRLAAAATCTFDNGSVGTLTVNYGNPSGIGFWGNDQLRVWGTDGFVEAVDGLTRLRYSPSEGPFEDLDMPEPGPTYFDRFVSSILDGTAMPYTLERELQSTRVAIAMKQAAETATTVVV